MAKLQKVVKGNLTKVTVLPQSVTRIGRGAGNSILLTTAASSKMHATIACIDCEWIVTDLGSRNGTHVNNVRIDRQSLRHGDILDFAGSRYLFLSDKEHDSSRDSDSSPGPNPHKVEPPIPDGSNVEISVRRSRVQTGDVVSSGTLIDEPGIDGARVMASVQMHNLPLGSWDYMESAKKLSLVLRLTHAIIAYHDHLQMDGLLRGFLDLFPQASHSLLAISDESAEGWRVVAAVSRHEGDPVFLCHPLVRRSMAECEGLLVTDHWRNEPNARPRLTELHRQSLLCVAVPGANGSCQGVVQLQASDPGNPFEESDLERLAVLAHVLGAGLSGIRLSS
ncbi:MAG TPA: FHA domain-containing protein [Planctomycetaceae bacterium]|nr:FHA domain-containing protein [Planctomycetaceae bacterium]HQZ66781.1 FHA domain-containing protein [Planctomycetaceae bacterium]